MAAGNGIKYASKFRQTVPVDVGQLAPKGGRIGSNQGERRSLAKAAQPESQPTKSAFQRVKDWISPRNADQLPAANAAFVSGDARHPFDRQIVAGKPSGNNALFDDRKLVAYLNTIAPKKAG